MNIKFCRNLISENLDLYELKMALFENGDPDELLLFVINSKMTLEASGMLTENVKLQYLRNLLRG